MIINQKRNFCYRICHIHNLPHILQNGIYTKHHPKAAKDFISIGNSEIIDIRDDTKVKIYGYGNIGDYVPFYFTPKSMMLFNIITGFRAPVVKKRAKNELMVIRCITADISKPGKFFFTDGQANVTSMSGHYNELEKLDTIDWDIIQNSDFKNDSNDRDKQRRYQAEFLVHNHVPVNELDSIHVYDEESLNYVIKKLAKTDVLLHVQITKQYFFD